MKSSFRVALFRPAKQNTIVLCVLMVFYILFSLLLFFSWINPSLAGETTSHIAADSNRYMYFADSLREGGNDPFVLMSMYSFPNTLWAPVMMAIIFPSAFLIVIVNYIIFLWSVWLLDKVANIRLGLFLALLLGNYTTLISLLSVNKEILDLLSTAFFCYWISRKRAWALVLALVIALVNRYEVCAAMLLYMVVQSRWNPIRKYRLIVLIVVCILCSIMLPIVLSHDMSLRLEEAQSSIGAEGSGLLIVLDSLQMHYLFFLATIPKMVLNLFGELRRIPHFDAGDPANTSIIFFNNVANLLVVVLLATQNRLRLRRDWMYYAAINAVIMSVTLVVQPRYFYSFYVILCFEAARMREPGEKCLRLAFREREAITGA